MHSKFRKYFFLFWLVYEAGIWSKVTKYHSTSKCSYFLKHVWVFLFIFYQLNQFCSTFCRCAVLVVSHGDTLQILQTILHAANQHKEPAYDDLASILNAVQVAPVLSQHRKYALLTGELRGVLWDFDYLRPSRKATVFCWNWIPYCC